ncbi:DUF6000 family protein [Acaryochloris marina]|nr:DUF6000 family protein [Acaryochloris marina]BDM78072.1 hypothetical protein AM10699_09420 [Acaryochloris marina MBIC10699]
MNKVTKEQLEMHIAESTVHDAGPYSNLEVPVVMSYPEPEFMAKWVHPFYLTSTMTRFTEFQHSYSEIRSQIDSALISKLLTYFNWRPRKVGSYFAAIENSKEHCQHIGRLLLRSDVRYAGQAHALALAQFNTNDSISYLCKYLDHYLQHPELQFDQGAVYGAVVYLDTQNGTKLAKKYTEQWHKFAKGSSNCVDGMAKLLESIRGLSSGPA